jgi:voltage-gated potassium channel|tara:strand:+ start:219 stop:836 length:618 start_codon:yes stop_codon:yes gene_type:complete
MSSRIDKIVLFLTCIIILEIWTSTLFTYTKYIKTIILYLDTLICFIFLYEFFLRLYRSTNKLEFIKYNFIDFISSIPLVESLRIGRIFRLLRILRLIKGGKNLFIFFEKTNLSKSLYSLCMLTLGIILFVSFSIYIIESQVNPGISFENILGITIESIATASLFKETLTSTSNNYLLIAILSGIMFISALTAIIISFFNQDKEAI